MRGRWFERKERERKGKKNRRGGIGKYRTEEEKSIV